MPAARPQHCAQVTPSNQQLGSPFAASKAGKGARYARDHVAHGRNCQALIWVATGAANCCETLEMLQRMPCWCSKHVGCDQNLTG